MNIHANFTTSSFSSSLFLLLLLLLSIIIFFLKNNSFVLIIFFMHIKLNSHDFMEALTLIMSHQHQSPRKKKKMPWAHNLLLCLVAVKSVGHNLLLCLVAVKSVRRSQKRKAKQNYNFYKLDIYIWIKFCACIYIPCPFLRKSNPP